ncbi:hypothetical protein F2Q69_00046029 [Brassica cretica]|uniref:Uncharacterized protein n=1 Tax=Brassica cretica TaxID=69181 RepID=A0A8S9PYR0_BRACR|nr:hypothetical protein F2Q69_00046029 [Brassica cretica]
MISECGYETSRLAGELLEPQGRWSETEAMLTTVKGSHYGKVSKLEIAIGELERDLRKTASSLLKEKKARKAKSSEVHRLQCQIENDAGLVSRGIREAKDAISSEFQARLAKISAFLGSLECIRNRDLALTTIEGGMAVVQSFQSETPPTLEAEEARLSGCKGDLAVVDGDFDLILPDLKSACLLPTCSEGPEGKDPVLGGDPAPALNGFILCFGTGRPCVALNPRRSAAFMTRWSSCIFHKLIFSARYRLRGISEDVEHKHRGMVLGSRIFWISCLEMLETSALGLGQDLARRLEHSVGFVSLIDGMISECGSETSRLAGELLELQGRWSETEAMLTADKGSHSVNVLKLEIAIGELERDLGKTASSLLKEKKATKAKSSEDALSSEFQARLAKISAFLGSLECIRNRDLALATIEGGMAVVQSFQSETPPTLEAEEA